MLGYRAFDGTIFVENCRAMQSDSLQLIKAVGQPGDFFSAVMYCEKAADFTENSYRYKLIISYNETEGASAVKTTYGARLYGNMRGWYFTSKDEADKYPALPTA